MIDQKRQRAELAIQIARNLREFGYRDVKAQLVLDELAKPRTERTIIGTFAAHMLVENGMWQSEDEVWTVINVRNEEGK